jgi:hypothetical protein
MGGDLKAAEMLHECCSKGCSGVGHFEGVDWHGFATDNLTGVLLLQHVAFGSSHTCTFCTGGGVN